MAKFFFCPGLFNDREEVEVHKLAKIERGQYIYRQLDRKSLVNKRLFGSRGILSSGTRRVVSRRQDIWVIDQVFGEDGWIFCVFMDRDEVFAFGEIFLTGYSGWSRAGKIAPSYPLG